MMRIKPPTRKKHLYWLIPVILLILVGGYVLLAQHYTFWPFSQKPTSINTSDAQTQQTIDKSKEDFAEKESDKQSETPTPLSKSATVIITDAAQYDDIVEVRSYISDHYEDGTCTISFSKGSEIITKQTPAYRDATTTICTNPLIKASEFPSIGEWSVTVSYEAADTKGTSVSQNISIR